MQRFASQAFQPVPLLKLEPQSLQSLCELSLDSAVCTGICNMLLWWKSLHSAEAKLITLSMLQAECH